MKILILSTSDLNGGAPRAAFRLNNALREAGVDSKMLVLEKQSDEPSVLCLPKWLFYAQRIFMVLEQKLLSRYRLRSKALFSPNRLGWSVVKYINLQKADVVHLHWICFNFITIKQISCIKAPIVWSLHDMWPFTGGCHYSEGCEGYKSSCGSCRVLGSVKRRDVSNRVLVYKAKHFARKPMTIVGLSSWMADCAKQSTMFSSARVVHLLNPLDERVYRPVDRDVVKDLFSLSQGKKYILFGAMNAASDPRKGYSYLMKALEHLACMVDTRQTELLVLGSSRPDSFVSPFTAHFLGRLQDDISLVALYNAADVAVVPSIEENLSNMITESLSCGTPVVAFSIGGNGDLIHHEQNGYLAKPFDPDDLAKGLAYCLDSAHSILRENARTGALHTTAKGVCADRYIELYKTLLLN